MYIIIYVPVEGNPRKIAVQARQNLQQAALDYVAKLNAMATQPNLKVLAGRPTAAEFGAKVETKTSAGSIFVPQFSDGFHFVVHEDGIRIMRAKEVSGWISGNYISADEVGRVYCIEAESPRDTSQSDSAELIKAMRMIETLKQELVRADKSRELLAAALVVAKRDNEKRDKLLAESYTTAEELRQQIARHEASQSAELTVINYNAVIDDIVSMNGITAL